ncbi:hypothetical protein AMAG_09335 [Allomyces macrogynus ATCC 38327]|uniref:Uncharacterized protein n=1 Tax=Allomyces macrogynus (strain ATCC 38327) TaxID=578462 RepID=A0A0L0SP60_ALLM3|nr:hypothetical protein AMAG_09335 [Allomyces macrogynus ATCC 38327]|eukprot:KNE64306.1 hypothetical protein AMAG_09335 [Allomyces macrogynus ATCC 38327]
MPDPPLPPIPIASKATSSSNSTSTATSTTFISTTPIIPAPTRAAPPSSTATDDPLALVPTNARSSNDSTIRAGLTVAALGPIVIFNVLLLVAIAVSVWCCAKRRRHAKMIRFRLPNSAAALPPDPVVREALLRPADNRMLDTIGRTASAAGTLPRYATIDRIRQQQQSHHTDRLVGPATLPRALRGSRHASQSAGHARRYSDLVTPGMSTHWNPHAPAFMSSTTSSLFPAMPPPEYGAHHLHAPASRQRSLTVPALLSSLTLGIEDDSDDGPLDSHLVREIQQHRAERSRPTTPTSASSRVRIGHAAVSPCESSSISCDNDTVVP